jgi:hypothetical protein
MRLRLAAVLLLAAPATAQLPRIHCAGLPTNLQANFSQVLWAPGAAADECYVLAPFGGAPAQEFPFRSFRWNSHSVMSTMFPAGWFEVRFNFPEWAYFSTAPCALQPAPGFTVPRGGINRRTTGDRDRSTSDRPWA